MKQSAASTHPSCLGLRNKQRNVIILEAPLSCSCSRRFPGARYATRIFRPDRSARFCGFRGVPQTCVEHGFDRAAALRFRPRTPLDSQKLRKCNFQSHFPGYLSSYSQRAPRAKRERKSHLPTRHNQIDIRPRPERLADQSLSLLIIRRVKVL